MCGRYIITSTPDEVFKLFSAVGSFKHDCVKEYHYEKTGDGKLKIVFTTANVESSMELLLSSVSLFSFDNDG